MTLIELKYIVAVGRERHFGRAAESCYVSQPTLSVAVKKLEDELGVSLFERGGVEVGITPSGQAIIAQAQKVLEAVSQLQQIARQGQDPLEGPLRVGVIHTVAPYLLPKLVRKQLELTPQMPLILQENFTVRLLELLRLGDLDCAIMALPLPDSGLEVVSLYREEFVLVVPAQHPWAKEFEGKKVNISDLKKETMLLLGHGHCFRDQVLEVCPEMSRLSASEEGIQRTFEGSSLETIRHMVSEGLGVTLLPKSALPENGIDENGLVKYIELEYPVPYRDIVLAWRRSFTRLPAVNTLANTIKQSGLLGVKFL